MTVLFENGTADGASPNAHRSVGGQHVITITGSFDGANVDLQIKAAGDPNAEWVTNKTYTTAEMDPVTYLPVGYEARGFINTAGASTDVFMEVRT